MTTDQPDLAELIKARGKVMHIQPADVLILSNVTGVDPGKHSEALSRLKDDLGVAKLYIFDEDIDITVLRVAVKANAADIVALGREGGQKP